MFAYSVSLAVSSPAQFTLYLALPTTAVIFPSFPDLPLFFTGLPTWCEVRTFVCLPISVVSPRDFQQVNFGGCARGIKSLSLSAISAVIRNRPPKMTDKHPKI